MCPSECTDFSNSLENATGSFVQTVEPHGAGKTKGMLGYMFWAAECPGSRAACTTPPNTCEGGVGVGAKVYKIPVPHAAASSKLTGRNPHRMAVITFAQHEKP